MNKIGDIKIGLAIGRKERNKYIWCACVGCGKERWVGLLRGQPESLRCWKCAAIKRAEQFRGENHPLWKGGRAKTDAGYLTVLLQPEDFFYPMTITRGRVFEHRLVMARYLGRNLHSWEIVHHKHTKYPAGSIEDKQDNRIENLQLVSDDRHKQISLLEKRIKQLEVRIDEQQKEIKSLRGSRELPT